MPDVVGPPVMGTTGAGGSWYPNLAPGAKATAPTPGGGAAPGGPPDPNVTAGAGGAASSGSGSSSSSSGSQQQQQQPSFVSGGMAAAAQQGLYFGLYAPPFQPFQPSPPVGGPPVGAAPYNPAMPNIPGVPRPGGGYNPIGNRDASSEWLPGAGDLPAGAERGARGSSQCPPCPRNPPAVLPDLDVAETRGEAGRGQALLQVAPEVSPVSRRRTPAQCSPRARG